jgi:hypothetical protein
MTSSHCNDSRKAHGHADLLSLESLCRPDARGGINSRRAGSRSRGSGGHDVSFRTRRSPSAHGARPLVARGLIPACGDIDFMRACSVSSEPPISHWTAGRFCDGCLGGGAGSMSQGLRVLVLLRCKMIHPTRLARRCGHSCSATASDFSEAFNSGRPARSDGATQTQWNLLPGEMSRRRCCPGLVSRRRYYRSGYLVGMRGIRRQR